VTCKNDAYGGLVMTQSKGLNKGFFYEFLLKNDAIGLKK